MSNDSGQPDASAKRDVFLSHASPDKERYVRPFATELARRGISYWLDEAEIEWGDSITRKINEGLSTSRYVVVFLSEGFAGRGWPEAELAAALNRENSEGQVVVLPVIIGDARTVLGPYPLLRDKVYLDGTKGSTYLADRLENRLRPTKLAEHVSPTDMVARSPSPSVEDAVAAVKRYILDERHRIALHDLVNEEVERVHQHLGAPEFDVNVNPNAPEEIFRRLKRYEAITETLRAIFVTGCYWGEQNTKSLWLKSIERVANGHVALNGYLWQINSRYYPALLLLYSGGVASLAAGNLRTLYSLISEPKINIHAEVRKGIDGLNITEVMPLDLAIKLPRMERHYTPLNDYIYDVIRSSLTTYLPDENDYDFAFTMFEYVCAVQSMISVERYGALASRYLWNPTFRQRIKEVDGGLDEDWEFLHAGFFDGSLERYKRLRDDLFRTFRGYRGM